MRVFLFLCFLTVPQAMGADTLLLDSLLARIGRESILLSDTKKFASVDKVLTCAGLRKRDKALPEFTKDILDLYIDEELIYLEAKEKKTNTVGMISGGVKAIQAKPECKLLWQSLGEKYGKLWKTKDRQREGEGLILRELEKRLLIDRIRASDVSIDSDIWNREARMKHPVKIYLE